MSAFLPPILFLNHTAMIGGAELVLLDVARHFRERSSVVLLSDGPLVDRLRAGGVRVEVIPAGAALLDVRRSSRLVSGSVLHDVARAAWLVQSRARVHHLVYANSQKAMVVGALASALARRPLVWHLHDILSREHFSHFNIRTAIALANVRRARVIANSQATANTFLAQRGRADRLRVVYNGIDPAPYQVTSKEVATGVRRGLRLPDGPVVGLFSRLSPWKGQEVLLRALTLLPNVQGLFVGDAMFGETEHKIELLRLATSLGLGERAHFLGFREDVPELLQAVDLVVHASTSAEPFGRVIVEGMLSERPVIATQAGGATELVENGVSGLLVPPGDHHALAAAISGLLQEPQRARLLAREGKKRALERFSLAAMLQGIVDEIAATAACIPQPPRPAA